jgi:hypothetical protein
MRRDIDETLKCIAAYAGIVEMCFNKFESKGFKLRAGEPIYKTSIIAARALDEEMRRLQLQRQYGSEAHETLGRFLMEAGWKKTHDGFKNEGHKIKNETIELLSSSHIDHLGYKEVIQKLAEEAECFVDLEAKKKLELRLCPICSNKAIDESNICGYCRTSYCEDCSGVRNYKPSTPLTYDTTKVSSCKCREHNGHSGQKV